jgi:hypothetical protein
MAGKLFLMLVLLGLSTCTYAQTIYVKVKKGSAYLGDEYLNADKGQRSLTGSSKLKVSKGAVVIARQDSKLVQLTSNKTYTKTQISTLLSAQKETSASSYSSVLFSDAMQKSTTIKSGSVSRGDNPSTVNWEDLKLSPMDGCIILSDTVLFEIHNQGVQWIDSVEIKNKLTSEKLFESLIFSNSISLSEFDQGQFEWSLPLGFINQEESNETYVYSSNFTIPDQVSKNQILEELNLIKKEISIFDADIQKELLNAICEQNGWCL